MHNLVETNQVRAALVPNGTSIQYCYTVHGNCGKLLWMDADAVVASPLAAGVDRFVYEPQAAPAWFYHCGREYCGRVARSSLNPLSAK